MIFRKIKNVFKEGFKNIWRNRGTAIASMVSIGAVLIILGILLIFILSVDNFVADARQRLDEIVVYLLDEATEEEVASIEKVLSEHEGVASLKYESKEDAMNKTKEEWGENADILEGLGFNPYPASYIIQIGDLSMADDIVESIENMSGVEKIHYYKDTIDTMSTIQKYIKYGGLIVTAVLVFISILIISNTIKIAVASRSREINIMKYVGAGNSYIRGPFIIEGIWIGLISSLIATAIVYFGYEFFFDKINSGLFKLVAVNLVAPQGIFIDLLILYVTIGVGIGALGSFISVKKFLNV